jgi:hypothetical protein
MKHRLNAHHSNDGINISSKRYVTSAAARRWCQGIGVKALGAKTISSCRTAQGAGDYAFAFRGHRRRAHRPRFVNATRQGRLVKAQHHRRCFVSGLFVYLFPRIRDAGR